MVKVRIPTPLRPMTGGKSEVETQASDIQAMIESLNGQFPGRERKEVILCACKRHNRQRESTNRQSHLQFHAPNGNRAHA